MLYTGQNITSNSDGLQPTSVEKVFLLLKEPIPQVKTLIANLRTIRTIDAKRYAELKRQLPYLVCGTFNPAFRRTENFAYIDCFVVDIDHITDKGLSISDLRDKFKHDERVELCFCSPSEDGLKLLFQLSEKCYDHGIFSLFYKAFVKQFSAQYGLEQVIDMRTSDVTRACFMSYDPQVYFNPIPVEVNISDYLDLHSPQALFELKKNLETQLTAIENKDVPTTSEPDKDAILRIKEILQLRKTKAEKAPVFVPEQLNHVMDGLDQFLREVDLTIQSVRDIQYGKQIHATLGIKQAECNVFFGKRGFRVVQSPKTGTNQELNQLMQELIQLYLDSL